MTFWRRWQATREAERFRSEQMLDRLDAIPSDRDWLIALTTGQFPK